MHNEQQLTYEAIEDINPAKAPNATNATNIPWIPINSSHVTPSKLKNSDPIQINRKTENFKSYGSNRSEIETQRNL